MARKRSGIPKDVELIERVRAHDEAAWGELVRLYGPLVAWWLEQSDLDRDDREDVFQDVFTTVARRVSDFRIEHRTDNFRGWLRVITRSRIVDHLRQAASQAGAEGGDDAQQRLLKLPAQSRRSRTSDDEGEISRVVQQALDIVRASVQPGTWDAFWSVVVEDRSPTDVAADLGVSPTAVRMAKSRVLRRLRELLSEV